MNEKKTLNQKVASFLAGRAYDEYQIKLKGSSLTSILYMVKKDGLSNLMANPSVQDIIVLLPDATVITNSGENKEDYISMSDRAVSYMETLDIRVRQEAAAKINS